MVKSAEESEERARLLDSPEHPEQSVDSPDHPELHQHHQPPHKEPQSPYSRKKIYRNNPLNLQQTTTFHFGDQFSPILEDAEVAGILQEAVSKTSGGWRISRKTTSNYLVGSLGPMMSDTEESTSQIPSTLQALRDIVEDMEQMVKEAGEEEGGEEGEEEGDNKINDAVTNDNEEENVDILEADVTTDEVDAPLSSLSVGSVSLTGEATSVTGVHNSFAGVYTTTPEAKYTLAGAHNPLTGVYTTSGGVQHTLAGVYDSSAGAYNSSAGAYNSSSGAYKSSPGAHNSLTGAHTTLAGTHNTLAGVPPSIPGSENCSSCRLPGSTDLIVDVHLESSEDLPRPPCVKHSFDRFPRCYSESRGNMSREEFRNLDRIETIGEERLRHMSEGAGRLRSRWRDSRGMFGSDKGIIQPTSSKSERKYEISEYDISVSSSNLGSMEDLESIASSSCSRLNMKAASRGATSRPLSSKLDAASSNRSFSMKAGVKMEDKNCLPEVKFEIYNDGNGGFEVDESYYDGQHHGMYTNIHPSIHSTPRYKDEENLGEVGSSFKTTMSSSSSTTSMPICRICQLPSIEPSNHLISPCRCLGSIRYVHNPCLLKWLEVCSRKNSDAPSCELCQFPYIRKKRFVISQCMFPSCSTRDRVLHSIFLLCVGLMVTCAGVTILCFKQDRDSKPKTVGPNTELSPSELMTLCCGVLFFLAFFIAMYVEVKAKNTVYQLICKFLYMNYDWTIQDYDRKKDPAKQIEDS